MHDESEKDLPTRKTTTANSDKLAQWILAQKLKEELNFSSQSKNESQPKNFTSEMSVVPLLSSEEVHEVRLILAPDQDDDRLVEIFDTHLEIGLDKKLQKLSGPYTFAIEVNLKSLKSTYFREGEILIVDPDKKAVTESFILLKKAANKYVVVKFSELNSKSAEIAGVVIAQYNTNFYFLEDDSPTKSELETNFIRADDWM